MIERKEIEKRIIVIGCSAGGLRALKNLFSHLKPDGETAYLTVLHLPENSPPLSKSLCSYTTLSVIEAFDKQPIEADKIYTAPGGYHLLVEKDFSISLSADEKINFSRPSIDLLFETAAEAVQKNLIAILLTGSNNDGTQGLKVVKYFNGKTIVQSPEEAEFDIMPKSAIENQVADYVVSILNIPALLQTLRG